MSSAAIVREKVTARPLTPHLGAVLDGARLSGTPWAAAAEEIRRALARRRLLYRRTALESR